MHEDATQKDDDLEPYFVYISMGPEKHIFYSTAEMKKKKKETHHF